MRVNPKAVRIAYRTSNILLFIVAALCMRDHRGVAGVLFTLGTAMIAITFAMNRRVDQVAAAVAARDVDALERIAKRTLAYRYQAMLLVGVLGSAARARALGRVTPCVCGKCEAEELDHELARALRACELLEKNEPREAMRLLKDAPRPTIAKMMHPTFALWVALHTKTIPAQAFERIESLAPKAGFMRWPLEAAIAKRLAQQGDIEKSRKHLERAPAAWRVGQ
jgi:hypothetical protein